MEKNYKSTEPESGVVRESSGSYYSMYREPGQLRKMTQAELDAECLTLHLSKEQIIERIHHHFHRE